MRDKKAHLPRQPIAPNRLGNKLPVLCRLKLSKMDFRILKTKFLQQRKVPMPSNLLSEFWYFYVATNPQSV